MKTHGFFRKHMNFVKISEWLEKHESFIKKALRIVVIVALLSFILSNVYKMFKMNSLGRELENVDVLVEEIYEREFEIERLKSEIDSLQSEIERSMTIVDSLDAVSKDKSRKISTIENELRKKRPTDINAKMSDVEKELRNNIKEYEKY